MKAVLVFVVIFALVATMCSAIKIGAPHPRRDKVVAAESRAPPEAGNVSLSLNLSVV